MAKKANKQAAKQQAQIQKAIAAAGSDGRIKASELQKVYQKYGQASVAAQLAPYAISNPNVTLGGGAKDLTGVRVGDGIATYAPRAWQTYDVTSGTVRQRTADVRPLGSKFVKNASGAFTYIGGAIPGAGGGTAADGTGATTSNPANDGSFENMQALYQQQMDAAQARINEMQSAQAQTIQGLTLDFNNQLAAASTSADQRIKGLNDLMLQQQANSQSTINLLQQQAQAAQAAYTEQARQASALSQAYVPNLNPSAATATLGDQRTTTRYQTNNSLSDLAIVSGLGTNTNPLAGLQLA
jgi:hypothetical protein